MSKKFIMGFVTAVFMLMASITAFAGTWKQDSNGWSWDNGNGTRPVNAWQWCDGNGDGVSECYYFDENGYCLINTMTPDGYAVNNDGAWIVDGAVQTQKVADGQAASTQNAAVKNNSGVDRLMYLKMYYGLPGETPEEKNAKMYRVFDLNRSFFDFDLAPITYKEITDFLLSIDWPNMSEYDKAKAVYDRVGTGYHGNYYSGAMGENIYEWSVFAYKRGICMDYANAYVALAELIGLETDTLQMCYKNQTPSGHMKAVVKIDGTWYAVDPTWANGAKTSIESNKNLLDDPSIRDYISGNTRNEEVNTILRSMGMEFNERGNRTNLP